MIVSAVQMEPVLGDVASNMKIEEIREKVFLLSKCNPPPWKEGKNPPWNDAVCAEIASKGIDSLLVLAESRTPFMVRTESGLWCIIKPLADPLAPLPAELAGISDFMSYERAQGRTAGVWIEYEGAPVLAPYIRTCTPLAPEDRPLPDNLLCCRPYRDGCSGELLCHGTPVNALDLILESGELKSKEKLSGMSEEELASYARENVGDPSDYYHYVCLGNGNCVAPDLVVASRREHRFVGAEEVDKNFYPAIRLFFKTREMHCHPRATFDGIHSPKIGDFLELDPYLIAVVIPEIDERGRRLAVNTSRVFEDRIVRLDHREHYGLRQWSDAAFGAAKKHISDR